VDVEVTSAPLHDAAVDLLAMGASDAWATELSGLDKKFDGHLLPLLKQKSFTGKPGSSLVVPSLGRIAARELMIVGVGDRNPEAVIRGAGKVGRQARDNGARTVGLALGGKLAAGALVEAVGTGNYTYDKFKPEAERTPAVEKLLLHAASDDGVAAAAARLKWQDFTRDLVNGPAAEVYPASLVDAAKKLGKLPHTTVEVLDLAQLQKGGAVGIVAVGQGSDNAPYEAIVRYRPPGARAHLALVGKGVTFDSGGLSLKTSAGMQTMRCDMAGAATVLGAIATAAELKLPVAVTAFIGCVENMNGGNSYKLGDVLAYRNGVTVEIHNTDAEGRLVLADCLIDACKEPGVTDVIDVATLTGAIVVALGPDFTGMYTPDDGLAAELDACSKQVGEAVWRMPLHEPYKAMLKGDWGQIKNVTGKPDAGSGTAALFLQHFVDGKRWAHLDIAGSAFFEKPSGAYAAGGTGQIVRTLVNWIASRG
jgi:leucyl aminopeptidase